MDQKNQQKITFSNVFENYAIRRSRHAESGGMFGFSNELRMRKISHSEVSVK